MEKPIPPSRDQVVQIRVTPGEKKKFDVFASRQGLGIGPWLRMLGMRECRDLGHDEPPEVVDDLPPRVKREKPTGSFQVRAWYKERPAVVAFTSNHEHWASAYIEYQQAAEADHIGRITVAHHPSGEIVAHFDQKGPLADPILRETEGEA